MSNTTATVTTWTLDSMHSSVGFSVRHLMTTNVRGEFQKVTATARYDADRPEASVVEASIVTASVSTREPQRDGHLRSADFFDAENHPAITFVSTGARRTGATSLDLTGNLTLRGVTRPVTFAVTDISGEQRDFSGNLRIGASATARIKRSDFGITFNKLLEAGGIAISDEVAITVDVAFLKNQAA